MVVEFRDFLQPHDKLSRECGWKIPPGDNARLTIVDGVMSDEDLGYIHMICWMYQKVNYS